MKIERRGEEQECGNVKSCAAGSTEGVRCTTLDPMLIPRITGDPLIETHEGQQSVSQNARVHRNRLFLQPKTMKETAARKDSHEPGGGIRGV